MSSLAWSDSYETEKEYETPQMIRDWYDQGYVKRPLKSRKAEDQRMLTHPSGLDGVAWSSDDVRDMFAGREYPNTSLSC